MATNENPQQSSYGTHAHERPAEGEFGRLARRAATDIKDLGSVALVEGRHGAARGRAWLEVAVRAHPLRGVLVALGLGAVLGYLVGRP